MGVASLVLGIVALVIAVFSGGSLGWIGLLMAIVGIVLGALGRKDPEKKGIATGGLVCSIVAASLGLILFIACAACASGASSGLKSLF